MQQAFILQLLQGHTQMILFCALVGTSWCRIMML